MMIQGWNHGEQYKEHGKARHDKTGRLLKVLITETKMFKLCTLGLLLGLLIPSQGTVPGTVVRVNQEALEYVCQQGKPSLLRGLEVIKIQNFVGRGQLLGSLLNVVGLIAPLELKLGSSISLDIRVGRTPGGFPVLSITACKSLLGDVQIVLGGNNLLGFLKPIQDHIRAALVDQMCLSVSNVVLGLNAKLGTLVGVNSINPMSRFQYSMLDTPEITSNYIDLDLNAAFALMGRPFDIPSGPEVPFSLPPPRKDDHDSMVNMGISEPLIGQMFATLMKSGVLNFNMRNPSNLKGYLLTTSMLEPAIPSIRQRFPKEVALGLNVVLGKFPVISFKQGAALLRVSLSVQVVVDTARSKSQAQTLCTLGVIKKMKEIIVSKLEKTFLAHMNGKDGYAQVNCDLDYVP
nr:PREDICTED: BPI fold-containing family B member 2 [Anolis carolinensis]|eukprot:XP_008119318.1 PREDICTED: BPI fold-containing family B member 2 [Anolis carolinensis]